MAIVDFALEHARQGRLVFPGIPNTKLPAFEDPYSKATCDEAKIIQWWQENPNRNICLPGGYEIAPGKFLGFIDIDTKNDGFKTVEHLEILGFDFPETLAQQTPTGGLHLFYYFDAPIRNSIGSLGKGLDTRGFHGYVIGAGSEINGKEYFFKNRHQIVQAPEWLVRRCRSRGTGEYQTSALGRQEAQGLHPKNTRGGKLDSLQLVHSVDQEAAKRKSILYLSNLEPATSGERNRRGYETACRLKDFGLIREHALECMLTNWRCEPTLEIGEIEHLVNSAFKYGQNAPGILAAEVIFDEIPQEPGQNKKPRHPVDLINDEYALVIQNGVRILREKVIDGKLRTEHLSVQAFHDIEANNLLTSTDDEGKTKTLVVSKMWMKSKGRRQYEGIIFAPNYSNPKLYNCWKGFAVGMPEGTPKPEASRALELFLAHIRENVCEGDLELTRWVLGFFAHLVQFPEKKPRVALVLRGRKGVGKNVITDCIFRLLGDHGILAANRRYLSGNFNSHLENKLLLVLDEAFWSGDKASEGILKDLITGSTHQIERKGQDSYSVANLVRVVIFGNEEWVVPATDDERRFAVFNVGDAKRGDGKYFGAIKDGIIEHGGDALLFKYLKEFDLSQVDVNVAPTTEGLMSQKEHSLGPLESWWLSSLRTGRIAGSSQDEWPVEIPRDLLRNSFYEEMKSQNFRGKLPNAAYFGRTFKQMAPSSCADIKKREGEITYRVYEIATLEKARQEWEVFIGGAVKWD